MVSALILVVFTVPLAIAVRALARERALGNARSDARAVTPILSLAGDPRVSGAIRSTRRQSAPRVLTVVFPDGSVLGDTEVIEKDPIADADALGQARAGRSFVTAAPGGAVVYEPVLRSNGTIAVIRVFVPRSQLERGVQRAWLGLALLGVFLIALAGIVADRLARSLVRSVAELASTANRLGRGDVSARSDPSGPPEIREVGVALNQLALRIDELLGTERQAAADLQHRLRTPVTALRAEAAGLRGEDRRRIELSVDELTTTIDAIIREAAEPVRRGLGVTADLHAIAARRAEFWQVLADEQRRRVEVRIDDGPLIVPVVESDLAAVFDVLVDNVFSHTPEGTPFQVTIERIAAYGSSDARFTIADAGPGFDVTAALRGRSASGSTGLGLDIARRIVTGAGGSFEVASTGTGTTVVCTLPLVPAA